MQPMNILQRCITSESIIDVSIIYNDVFVIMHDATFEKYNVMHFAAIDNDKNILPQLTRDDLLDHYVFTTKNEALDCYNQYMINWISAFIDDHNMHD